MADVMVIWNAEESPPGRLVDALKADELPWRDVRPDLGEELPGLDRVRGMVVLGGPMGAYEEAKHPWLRPEKDLIRAAVDAELPVLGICLGAQLIADSLGGRAYRAPRAEVGLIELTFTPAGRNDPVVGSLPSPVLAFHQDTFDLPPDATLLAHSDRFPHAFRHGSAVGLQFHPETPIEVAARWAADASGTLLKEAGTEVDAFVDDLVRAAEVLDEAAVGLFHRWLAELTR